MSARTYLQSHGIHETLQDCVHDLVLTRPNTTLEVLETLQKRIETNKTHSNSDYYVILGASPKDEEAIAKHLGDIAVGRGAIIADCAALSAAANAAASSSYSYQSRAATPLIPPKSTAFVINVNAISDAIRLDATSGVCKGCVVVAADKAALDSREYLLKVNPVAQYYSVKAVGGMHVVDSITEVNGALV